MAKTKKELDSEIEVKVFPVTSKKASKYGLLANAQVTINGEFCVRHITIRESKKGDEPFVCFPSEKGSDGKYYDVFFPISKAAASEIKKAIIEEYENTID